MDHYTRPAAKQRSLTTRKARRLAGSRHVFAALRGDTVGPLKLKNKSTTGPTEYRFSRANPMWELAQMSIRKYGSGHIFEHEPEIPSHAVPVRVPDQTGNDSSSYFAPTEKETQAPIDAARPPDLWQPMDSHHRIPTRPPAEQQAQSWFSLCFAI